MEGSLKSKFPYKSVFSKKMVKGILPIKINIPKNGKKLKFFKLLIIENEKVSLRLRYLFMPSKITALFKFLFYLGIVILIVQGFRMFFGGRNK